MQKAAGKSAAFCIESPHEADQRQPMLLASSLPLREP
jgi:hypothetical protein